MAALRIDFQLADKEEDGLPAGDTGKWQIETDYENAFPNRCENRWFRYRKPNHPNDPWWYNSLTEDWFLESDWSWQLYTDPHSANTFWWKNDSEWFWTRTGQRSSAPAMRSATSSERGVRCACTSETSVNFGKA